jgi:hypothetical protein
MKNDNEQTNVNPHSPSKICSEMYNNLDFQKFSVPVGQTKAFCATAHCTNTYDSHFTIHIYALSRFIQI